VRKHLSAVKGGRLAIHIHPAEIINLIVIDEVAGKPWGPTIPDGTTFKDAKEVLTRHSLWEKTPNKVRQFIEHADQSFETPKEDDFKEIGIKTETFILADNNRACEAALAKARELGFNASILTTVMEGESKDVGRILSAIAREIEKNGRPLEPPCVLISGGETTVTIEGQAGEGGRNQELVLSASQYIQGSKAIVIASIGTDGTDGPTDIAGAIADGHSVERAKREGLDIKKELSIHNSSLVFRKLGDAIFTGPTGTNVMDLQLIVVLSRA